MEQERNMGPTPMDIGEARVNEWSNDWRVEEWEVDAVAPNTQCYNCGGYGHTSRTCQKGRGKAKGKGKGSGGKGGDKGSTYGKGKAKGKGNYNGGKEKGQTWGYQGVRWRCNKVGHKAWDARPQSATK